MSVSLHHLIFTLLWWGPVGAARQSTNAVDLWPRLRVRETRRPRSEADSYKGTEGDDVDGQPNARASAGPAFSVDAVHLCN